MSDKLTALQRTYIAELLHISERLAAMGVKSISPAVPGWKQYTSVYLEDDPAGLLEEAEVARLNDMSDLLTVSLSEARISFGLCRPHKEVPRDVDP